MLSREIGKSIQVQEKYFFESASQFQSLFAGSDGNVSSGTRDTIYRLLLYYNFYGIKGNTNVLQWLIGRKPTSVEEFLRNKILELNGSAGPWPVGKSSSRSSEKKPRRKSKPVLPIPRWEYSSYEYNMYGYNSQSHELFPMKSHMILKEPLGQGEYLHLRLNVWERQGEKEERDVLDPITAPKHELP